MAEFALPAEAADLLHHPYIVKLTERLDTERQAYMTEARRLADLRQSMAQQRQVTGAASSTLTWDAGQRREKKAALYDLYLQSSLLGSIVDVIAKRFITGAWSIAPMKTTVGGVPRSVRGKATEQLALADFFAWCNEDQDLNQMLYGSVIDLCIFGETFYEVVPRGSLPYELYPLNAMRMDTLHDKYGRVLRYTFAEPDSPSKPQEIDPEWIVRIWLPNRRNVLDPFSLVEGMVNPLYTDNMMVKTQQKTFENMDSSSELVYTMPENAGPDEARKLQANLEETQTGVINAGRAHIAYGGTTITALQRNGLDAPFLDGRKDTRVEIMGRAHVPPHMVSQIESGNLGGGTGDAQERSFTQNCVQFYEYLIFTKINSRIVRQMFRINAWTLVMTFADSIGDPYAPKVLTVNEKRGQQGLPPVVGGDITFAQLEAHADMMRQYGPFLQPDGSLAATPPATEPPNDPADPNADGDPADPNDSADGGNPDDTPPTKEHDQ